MNDESAGELSFPSILTLSEYESGAFGYADASFVSRGAKFVDWINASGPYSGDRIGAMQEQIKHLVTRRLQLALDRKQHAGIADEPIERPVFIIGFARSGTTLLHSLLAEDREVQKLRSWHVYSPSPPPGAGPIAADRVAYAQRRIEAWIDFCPAHRALHPYIDQGAFQLIEDEEVFTLDLRGAYPWHLYRVPCLDPSAVLLSEKQSDAYRFHRSLLQHLQWNTGLRRWVCKGPSAQMHLEALFDVYPDALCIWTHRPIGEIYASNVAIRAVTYNAIQGRAVDWRRQAQAHVEKMKAAVDRLLASKLVDDPRILHLSFRDIAADPVGSVRKVYERQQLDFTDEIAQGVRRWLDNPANAADRYGRYPYSYENFGLDRAWVEALFADYSRRFGLI